MTPEPWYSSVSCRPGGVDNVAWFEQGCPHPRLVPWAMKRVPLPGWDVSRRRIIFAVAGAPGARSARAAGFAGRGIRGSFQDYLGHRNIHPPSSTRPLTRHGFKSFGLILPACGRRAWPEACLPVAPGRQPLYSSASSVHDSGYQPCCSIRLPDTPGPMEQPDKGRAGRRTPVAGTPGNDRQLRRGDCCTEPPRKP
jgi:hypothetical protein